MWNLLESLFPKINWRLTNLGKGDGILHCHPACTALIFDANRPPEGTKRNSVFLQGMHLPFDGAAAGAASGARASTRHGALGIQLPTAVGSAEAADANK